MFKQTILATAAAGFIALGGLGVTASSASAASAEFQANGPGWSLQFGNRGPGPQFHPQRFCEPVYKKVKWWDRFGRSHWSVITVGERCPPRHFDRYDGPGRGGPGWDGPGRGPGRGW